ncbi:MAG TPA: HdeD family acid-resistance protein [Myxococcales bacterium]|nr:HdeD family acid-resistance protein [Myxococcales bacterium]
MANAPSATSPMGPAAVDPFQDQQMVRNLAQNWWALVIRGVAGVLFGIGALVWPPAAVAVLVLLFGAYALMDGIFNIVAAVRAPREGRRWGWLLFSGVTGIATGLIAFFFPGITAVALVLLVASWSVVTGVAEIIAAIRLRKLIRHEWLLILSGLLSVAFGVLLFLLPAAGAVALAIWIGAYMLVFGALLIGFGIRLRSWNRTNRTSETGAPGAALPRPA